MYVDSKIQNASLDSTIDILHIWANADWSFKCRRTDVCKCTVYNLYDKLDVKIYVLIPSSMLPSDWFNLMGFQCTEWQDRQVQRKNWSRQNRRSDTSWFTKEYSNVSSLPLYFTFSDTVLERDTTARLRIILPLGKMLDLLFLMIPSTLDPSLCYFSVVFGNIDLLNNKSGISIYAHQTMMVHRLVLFIVLSQWDTAEAFKMGGCSLMIWSK